METYEWIIIILSLWFSFTITVFFIAIEAGISDTSEKQKKIMFILIYILGFFWIADIIILFKSLKNRKNE